MFHPVTHRVAPTERACYYEKENCYKHSPVTVHAAVISSVKQENQAGKLLSQLSAKATENCIDDINKNNQLNTNPSP